MGHFIAREYIFWVVGLWSLLSIASEMMIRTSEVDPVIARGAQRDERGSMKIGPMLDVLKDRRVAVFALTVLLFHFGNVAMLPLVGQELTANADGQGASLWMSACIILAQLVMIPVAMFAGPYADL
ncbi:hypothetical protein [Panacagrimonas sp.]|uniref:hypothetical protein n=1 Tax=Panacagrimonas sp. TaxID=2480088 RepID=UPI003B523CA4